MILVSLVGVPEIKTPELVDVDLPDRRCSRRDPIIFHPARQHSELALVRGTSTVSGNLVSRAVEGVPFVGLRACRGFRRYQLVPLQARALRRWHFYLNWEILKEKSFSERENFSLGFDVALLIVPPENLVACPRPTQRNRLTSLTFTGDRSWRTPGPLRARGPISAPSVTFKTRKNLSDGTGEVLPSLQPADG